MELVAVSPVRKFAYKVHFCPAQESGRAEAGWSVSLSGMGHTLLSASSHTGHTTLQRWGRVNAGANSALIKQQKINGNVNETINSLSQGDFVLLLHSS